MTRAANTILAGAAAALLGTAAAPAAAQVLRDPPTPFGPLRYDNDFRAPARTEGNLSQPLKNLQLVPDDPDVYVNLGGSLRERFEAFSQAAFGFRQAGGTGGEQYLLHRLLVDTDVHLGRNLRIFVQLSNHTEAGRQPGPSPTDIDRGDLQQAFFDVTGPIGIGDVQAGFRGGRQEMMYGSNRLVDIREGPNIRQSFDGARGWITLGGTRIDAFWTRPTFNRSGWFDDRPDPGQQFYGIYATNAAIGTDLYLLGLDRNGAVLDAGTADERRKTVGTRIWGTTAGVDYNFEAAYQFGRWGRRPISAYALFSDTGYTLDGVWGRPRLALKADVTSGGNSRGSGSLGTFYPLFPKNNYYTEANIQTTSNNIDVYPYVQIQPRRDLAFLAGAGFNWRYSTKDAFYQPPGAPVAAGNANGRRYAGMFTNLQVEWQPHPNLNVNAAYVHYNADGFLRAAGGRDIDWVGAWTTVNF